MWKNVKEWQPVYVTSPAYVTPVYVKSRYEHIWNFSVHASDCFVTCSDNYVVYHIYIDRRHLFTFDAWATLISRKCIVNRLFLRMTVNQLQFCGLVHVLRPAHTVTSIIQLESEFVPRARDEECSW